MKRFLPFLLFVFTFFGTKQSQAGSTCNWGSRIPYFLTWDSCASKLSKNKGMLNGYIAFNYAKSSCFKYQWTVNGNNVTTNRAMTFMPSTNGKYSVCVKVTDTCNGCDTTFCSSMGISCLGSTTSSKCNWGARNPYFYSDDSCYYVVAKNKGMLNGYIGFNSSISGCMKYQWTVDGKAISTGNVMHFMPTANGTYSVCVKVTDTCKGCDTTYCVSHAISCFGSSTSKCNWKSRNPYFLSWDSCGSANSKNKGMIYGYMAFSYAKATCFKYQWTINGNNVTTNKAMTYMPSANGKYAVCVKVTDTCSGCDTTFCSYIGITCLSSNSATCNWQSRNPYFLHWDSCGTKGVNNGKIYGYIYFNYAKMGCFKYQWTIDGKNITTNRSMTNMPSANGKYAVCVKVTDTCSGCDTTFCAYVGITCLKSNTSKCDWKSRNAYFFAWDSCGAKVTSHKSMINGYIAFNYAKSGCFKYQWTVNGNKIATTRPLQCWATANGTYSVCVKVTDTCMGCDTTYCGTVTINCLGTSNSKCNWSSRKPYFIAYDSCYATSANKGKIYGFVYFNYTKSGCFKYQWTVNGTNVSNDWAMEFATRYNGTYSVCLKVSDTCMGCDTSFCRSIVISCLSSSTSKCNWQSRNPYFMTWDSCKSAIKNDKIYGYVGFNYAKSSCFKYQWSVNDTIVSTARYFNYQVYANGNYKMCVKIVDTCNNCDTLFCNTLTVKCFGTTNVNKMESNQLAVYPNPTTGVINILGVNSSVNYILRDINGRVLINDLLSENKIDISEFQQGVYLLSIQKDSIWINTKIIRN